MKTKYLSGIDIAQYKSFSVVYKGENDSKVCQYLYNHSIFINTKTETIYKELKFKSIEN